MILYDKILYDIIQHNLIRCHFLIQSGLHLRMIGDTERVASFRDNVTIAAYVRNVVLDSKTVTDARLILLHVSG